MIVMKEEQNVVVPGENLGERNGRRLGIGVYEEGSHVFSGVLGVPRATENEIFVIPHSGVYIPRQGDMVIGRIKSVEVSGWFVDINSPYLAFMPTSEAVDKFEAARSELSKFYGIGETIYCIVSKVTNEKNVQVSMDDRMAKKLENGVLLQVVPTKVPRIIGKAASMLKLIKSRTGCNLLVGQNGVVWLDGDDKTKAIESILTIERESHFEGLTEKIEKLLGGS